MFRYSRWARRGATSLPTHLTRCPRRQHLRRAVAAISSGTGELHRRAPRAIWLRGIRAAAEEHSDAGSGAV
eukprot:SAG25_NODE_13218_length_270_cov_0.590643_1_plen_70_part_01